jgi:predicted phosphoribosyltransferase
MKNYRDKNAVIYAIPGGGVPLGYYLAKDFNFPMELLFVKKIAHPDHRKPSIGAVSLADRIIDERLNVPDAYIKNEISRIRKSLKAKQKLFSEGNQPLDVAGKYAIIVDDGIETGKTMISAIRMIRKLNPSKIAVVTPVASWKGAALVDRATDDFVCLHTVNNSGDVSLNYLNFPKVSDREIGQMLKAANRLDNAA